MQGERGRGSDVGERGEEGVPALTFPNTHLFSRYRCEGGEEWSGGWMDVGGMVERVRARCVGGAASSWCGGDCKRDEGDEDQWKEMME